MQIVIDIPEDEYQHIMRHYEQFPRDLSRYERRIIDGTPLPKGHGCLIDKDALIGKIHGVRSITAVLDAEVIVKADGGDRNG